MTHHYQIPLFDRTTFNITKLQKEAMHAAVKRSPHSREQIVDAMNDLASRYGVSLVSNGAMTLDTFEKWVNPNELNRQMPMRVLPIFCAVIGDSSAIDVLAAPTGSRVIGPEDQNLLKWAKAYQRERDARIERRRIEKDL